MMNNCVVKEYRINDIYGRFLEILRSSEFCTLARKKERDFSSKEISELYSERCDIEANYKFFKIDLEAERFNANCPYVFKCKVIGKLISLNFIGIIKAKADSVLIKKGPQNIRMVLKQNFVLLKISYTVIFFEK